MFPYIIYASLGVKRYLKFENVGTFNIKWKLKWYTKLKFLLSYLLAVSNTYEFIKFQIGGYAEILMIVVEIVFWITYGPLLIFDLKRALHHDWSFHFPFHITLVASSLY